MSNVIKDIEQLKSLAKDNSLECYIALAGGIARSSKTITYDEEDDRWEIFNEIDSSFQRLKTKNLAAKTLIIEALEKGALYKYD